MTRARRAARSGLPVGRSGSASTTTTRSGVLKRATPRCANHARHASRSKPAAPRRTRRPARPSRRRASRPRPPGGRRGGLRARARPRRSQMFSPPRMITSLRRPTIVEPAVASSVARSPVRNQPSASNASAVSAGVEVADAHLRARARGARRRRDAQLDLADRLAVVRMRGVGGVGVDARRDRRRLGRAVRALHDRAERADGLLDERHAHARAAATRSGGGSRRARARSRAPASATRRTSAGRP